MGQDLTRGLRPAHTFQARGARLISGDGDAHLHARPADLLGVLAVGGSDHTIGAGMVDLNLLTPQTVD